MTSAKKGRGDSPRRLKTVTPSLRRADPPKFAEMTPDDFEEFCCALLDKEPRVTRADLYHTRFDAQYGSYIDVDKVDELFAELKLALDRLPAGDVIRRTRRGLDRVWIGYPGERRDLSSVFLFGASGAQVRQAEPRLMFVERHQTEVQHQPAGIEAIGRVYVAIMQQTVSHTMSNLRASRMQEYLVDVERQIAAEHRFDVGAMVTEKG